MIKSFIFLASLFLIGLKMNFNYLYYIALTIPLSHLILFQTFNLKTENGADIDGYIKKTNKSKSTLTGDFLFKKKDKKEPTEAEDRPEVVNKEILA